MTYAARTTVPVAQTKTEIERTLERYGAQKFFTGWDHEQAVIGFNMKDRFVEFRLPIPPRKDFHRNNLGNPRSSPQIEKAWEQAQRSAWRALLLCIKAKLESVESGVESFEEAFLAQIMVSDGNGAQTTIGRSIIPQIEAAYELGKPPRLELNP